MSIYFWKSTLGSPTTLILSLISSPTNPVLRFLAGTYRIINTHRPKLLTMISNKGRARMLEISTPKARISFDSGVQSIGRVVLFRSHCYCRCNIERRASLIHRGNQDQLFRYSLCKLHTELFCLSLYQTAFSPSRTLSGGSVIVEWLS